MKRVYFILFLLVIKFVSPLGLIIAWANRYFAQDALTYLGVPKLSLLASVYSVQFLEKISGFFVVVVIDNEFRRYDTKSFYIKWFYFLAKTKEWSNSKHRVLYTPST